jgi:hypothetical protein
MNDNRSHSNSSELLASALGSRTLTTNLHRYLRLSGWEPQPPGPAGSLWYHSAPQRETLALAVPEPVEPDTGEWRGIVQRLAAFEERPAQAIMLSIITLYIDVTRLRTSNDVSYGGSIPLDAGVSLVQSAKAMLRSAATAARRPRSQIAGNYSKLGDEIAHQARMAHTEDGSYVVPIWIPLTPDPEDQSDTIFIDDREQRMPFETPERRVTRTFAQSLEAVDKVVVQPDSPPRKAADLLPLVAAGGTRELVVALQQILEQPTVAQFEVDFSWAGGLMPPGGVARRVVLDAQAAPLLKEAARLLRLPDRFPREIYTGKIIMIMHRPNEPAGEIGIDTVRQNRRCEVRVQLDLETLDKAYDWARTSRAVLVEGEVRRGGPGRKLRIDDPSRVLPLDETFLPVS